MPACDYIVLPVGNESEKVSLGFIFSHVGGRLPRPLARNGANYLGWGCHCHSIWPAGLAG